MKIVKKITVAICLALVMTLAVPSNLPNNVGQIATVEAASKVKINKKKATLIKGQTLQLKVTGTSKTVKWSTSKKSVATVNSKGKVTAKKKGTATITAKVGKKSYKCKITVETPKMNETFVSLTIGETYTLKLAGNSQKIKWSSSDKKVATVSNKGVVKGVGAGIATITAKVGKKKYKCDVIVEKKTIFEPIDTIDYISDRRVEYNSTLEEHRVFFSLKLSDGQTRVASSGVINIKIVNDENVEVYNKQVPFTQNDFGNWTWALYGTKYICCIKIPDSELIKSTSTSGKLMFSVKLNDGTSFPEGTYNISELPLQDLKEVCRVTMPVTPKNLYYYSYSGKLYSTCQITNMDYSVKKSYDGIYRVTINLSGQKTYDYQGNNYSDSCKIGWKLYKGDVVVESGTIYTSELAVGEKFANETATIYNLDEGDYRLELLDVR